MREKKHIRIALSAILVLCLVASLFSGGIVSAIDTAQPIWFSVGNRQTVATNPEYGQAPIVVGEIGGQAQLASVKAPQNIGAYGDYLDDIGSGNLQTDNDANEGTLSFTFDNDSDVTQWTLHIFYVGKMPNNNAGYTENTHRDYDITVNGGEPIRLQCDLTQGTAWNTSMKPLEVTQEISLQKGQNVLKLGNSTNLQSAPVFVYGKLIPDGYVAPVGPTFKTLSETEPTTLNAVEDGAVTTYATLDGQATIGSGTQDFIDHLGYYDQDSNNLPGPEGTLTFHVTPEKATAWKMTVRYLMHKANNLNTSYYGDPDKGQDAALQYRDLVVTVNQQEYDALPCPHRSNNNDSWTDSKLAIDIEFPQILTLNAGQVNDIKFGNPYNKNAPSVYQVILTPAELEPEPVLPGLLYEAEDAQGADGHIVNKTDYGISGDNYVQGFDQGGLSLDFTVNVEQAGAYILHTRYVNYDHRNFYVQVNGSSYYRKVHCPGTGIDWNNTPGIAKDTVVILNQGENHLVYSTPGENAPKLDCISLEPVVLPVIEDMPGVIYEAEDAAVNDLAKMNVENSCNVQYASGGLHMEGFDNKGLTLTFTVNVEQAGDYTLYIRYLSMWDRNFEIEVNGAPAVAVTCPAGKSWHDQCDVTSTTVTLNQGANTLAFSGPSEGLEQGQAFAPSLDCISIEPAAPKAAIAAMVQAGVASRAEETGLYDLTWNVELLDQYQQDNFASFNRDFRIVDHGVIVTATPEDMTDALASGVYQPGKAYQTSFGDHAYSHFAYRRYNTKEGVNRYVTFYVTYAGADGENPVTVYSSTDYVSAK